MIFIKKTTYTLTNRRNLRLGRSVSIYIRLFEKIKFNINNVTRNSLIVNNYSCKSNLVITDRINP